MTRDHDAASRHAPDLPAGGLRRLSQRYADGALSESGYRAARRSFIDRVIAGDGKASDTAATEPGSETFEATQPLPRPPRPLTPRGQGRRSLIALLVVLLTAGTIVFLIASP